MNVVCMKWGSSYGPEYVNRLHSGVRRHLDREVRFVCFTEDGSGVDPGVEIQPLPATGGPDTADTRWRKLGLFQPGLGGLSGTTLFLDLDVVIVGDLEPFLRHPGDFCALRDAQLFPPRWTRRMFRPSREAFYQRVANTSVFRYRIGAHADALQRYNANATGVLATYRNEQEYLSDHLHAQGKLRFWPPEWCASFKHDCVPGAIRSRWIDPLCPPSARIVVFAGRPKMAEVLAGQGSRWYRRIGPAPWLSRAWAGEEAVRSS